MRETLEVESLVTYLQALPITENRAEMIQTLRDGDEEWIALIREGRDTYLIDAITADMYRAIRPSTLHASLLRIGYVLSAISLALLLLVALGVLH